MYEVELKFQVSDAAALERDLLALGGRFGNAVEQVDRYFAHPCRDFAATDEALRLRRTGTDVAITWKGPRIDATTKTRREIELAVTAAALGGGPVAIDRWTGLLEALGFRQVREVAKRRRAALVAWEGAEVEASLDAVTGLGDYLELELQADADAVPLARGRLESLARRLGCGPAERRSYLELLLG
ncbi:MAG: class IV adenylate cyclase [Planctomycetaceae bacterium]|nr:class IV adenylate cyclase [Planctomycetaceae bacterium]